MRENYTNYTKPHYNSEPAVETTPAPVTEAEPEITAEELQEIAETLDTNLATALEEANQPIEPIDGVVTATKLNVRKLPSPNAEVLAVINQNSKVQIDTEASTVDWYKVYTAAGVEGYCMKKFITVK